MGIIQAKPEWVDTDPSGTMKCQSCTYFTSNWDHLQKHTQTYHPEDGLGMILYMECTGSIDGRNAINEMVSVSPIDCTGGQSAYEDDDLEKFGRELVKASRATGYKIGRVYRMADPGLGLDFPQWWVEGGLKAGVFQQYVLPLDVQS